MYEMECMMVIIVDLASRVCNLLPSRDVQIVRITPSAEMAAIAKQAEDYIWSSVKLAYDRVSLLCQVTWRRFFYQAMVD